MQVGGSIGVSVFTAVYASVFAASGVAGADTPTAMADGYGATFTAAAIGMVGACVIAIVMVRGARLRELALDDAAPVSVAVH